MGFGITINPGFTIYSKIDSGDGLKNYSSSVIEFDAPMLFINGSARVPSMRHELNLFVNGINANEGFTFTQTGRDVSFQSKIDFTKFQKSIILSMEVVKK